MITVVMSHNSSIGDPFRGRIGEQAAFSMIAMLKHLSPSEMTMSYALFEDEEKLTRSFPSRQEVWNAAERAGLVVPGPNGKMVLEDHFEIKPCEPDPNEISVDPDSDFSPICRLILPDA